MSSCIAVNHVVCDELDKTKKTNPSIVLGKCRNLGERFKEPV